MMTTQELLDQAKAWDIRANPVRLDRRCSHCDSNVHVEFLGDNVCPYDAIWYLVTCRLESLPEWEEGDLQDDCDACGGNGIAKFDGQWYCEDCAFDVLRQPIVKSASKR